MALSKDRLHSLILKFSDLNSFSKSYLYFVRQDGLILYSHSEGVKTEREEEIEKIEKEIQSIGALLGGMWQSAEALKNFFPNLQQGNENANENEKKNDSLFFGNSSKGFFILPLELKSENCFISLAFEGERNPALLKNKLRLLKNYLREGEEKFVQAEKKSHLFQNITDDEIDNLFPLEGDS